MDVKARDAPLPASEVFEFPIGLGFTIWWSSGTEYTVAVFMSPPAERRFFSASAMVAPYA